ncbi:hypothetical protein L1987_61625 [Smallanthus sonchifolius]|uniref:Uncharacterized protein n=1 Tax=Smallanthus sonchifolius TaxID=185202 RepID=A0ACB9C893_9ASTR|nr:hypothetical protein L1987_61625 [Smallanthus sonchifolius]
MVSRRCRVYGDDEPAMKFSAENAELLGKAQGGRAQVAGSKAPKAPHGNEYQGKPVKPGGISFRDVLLKNKTGEDLDEVIEVPEAVQAFVSKQGRDLVGRTVDFTSLRTLNFLLRKDGWSKANVPNTSFESGNCSGEFVPDSVERKGRSKDFGTSENVEEVEESVEVTSPRDKEEVNGLVRNPVVQSINAGHGKVDYAFRSADNNDSNRTDPVVSNFEANLVNVLSQAHSRSRKRPRSEDPFNLNELLGLKAHQGVQ